MCTRWPLHFLPLFATRNQTRVLKAPLNFFHSHIAVLRSYYLIIVLSLEFQPLTQTPTGKGDQKSRSHKDFNSLPVAYFSIQIRTHLERWVESGFIQILRDRKRVEILV